MALRWQPILSVDDITQQQWQQLSNDKTEYSSPFLSYTFLKGLELTHCVDGKTGWYSHHIGVYECAGDEVSESTDKLIGFVPCYLKTHSYGEYVFDHAWANAYQQHQIPYYPKLVACIPFTPVTGSRLLLDTDAGYSFAEINAFVMASTDAILEKARASSFHYLFVPEYQSELLAQDNILQRLSVQFVWQNRGYADFDDFMQHMTSRKRRSIRKERASALRMSDIQSVVEKNASVESASVESAEINSAKVEKPAVKSVVIKRLSGDALTPEVLADFYLCYQQTYLKRSGHTGYLTEAFFEYLQSHMQDNMMIVMAYSSELLEDSKDELAPAPAQKCIAAALFFYNEEQLFGRYWGALEDVSGLHFECCYYQGIEFAIEKQLRQFNPGTQGEHKILRGFEPTLCYSNHYLQHPDFQEAIKDFLHREKIGIENYKTQAEQVLPFKTP